jgi:hypothetical protein
LTRNFALVIPAQAGIAPAVDFFHVATTKNKSDSRLRGNDEQSKFKDTQ